MIYNLYGVDYSITSPGIAFYCGDLSEDVPNLKNIKFASFGEIKANGKPIIDKKAYKNYKNFKFEIFENYKNSIDRWDIHTSQVLNFIEVNENIKIAIEGYSFASKGLVYNIAECIGDFKRALYHNNLPFIIFQPSEIKKLITSKGNAKKDLIRISLEKLYQVDFKEFFNIPVDISPSSDMLDALAILVVLYKKIQTKIISNNEFINKN